MNLQRDKLYHAAVGAACALTILVLAKLPIHAAMVIAAFLLGFAYEGLQKLRGEGTPDLQDALATGLGGALLTAASYILFR